MTIRKGPAEDGLFDGAGAEFLDRNYPEHISQNHISEAVLGIDIGIRGAVALINRSGELLAIEDMPCLNDGPAGRRNVNAALLAEIVFKAHAALAFVEHVSARPGEGPTGAFAFGRCRGLIEGVLAAAGVPIRFLTPPTWKRAVGIAPGRDGAKDAARGEAIRRWPSRAFLFARVKDDGRAEACLIAIAGILRREGRQ
jgi:crossover junction endodeoxyribonuclease RuvC